VPPDGSSPNKYYFLIMFLFNRVGNGDNNSSPEKLLENSITSRSSYSVIRPLTTHFYLHILILTRDSFPLKPKISS
jgi:hypothetical protein